MRQLRTLVNEAINQGYMHADAYPFRKYKIKQEKGRHEFLTPDELKKLETVEVEEKSMRHVLDAFLFCCYTGLRYSDFCQLTPENFIRVNGKRWLYFKSVKTGVEIRLPLHLLFESRALGILDRYPDIGSFAALPCNSEVNKQLRKLAGLCGIKTDNLPCEPSYLCHPAGSSGGGYYHCAETARTYFRKDHTDLFGGTFQHHCA